MTLFLFAVSGLLCCHVRTSLGEACQSEDGSLVNTDYGCIRGAVSEFGRRFSAIPYATPPTPENDLRFRDPVPPKDWTPDTLDVTGMAPVCMQEECDERSVTCYKHTGAAVSEDCLYLSVFTPPIGDDDGDDGDDGDGLPVMFWIHGMSMMCNANKWNVPFYRMVQKVDACFLRLVCPTVCSFVYTARICSFEHCIYIEL